MQIKKLLIAAATVGTMALTASASAWWGDNGSNDFNSNWNNNSAGNGYGSGNGYGNGAGNGYGDGSGDMDGDIDGEVDFSFKAKGRGRGKGNGRSSYYGNGYGNGAGNGYGNGAGNNSWDNKNRFNNANGYGYQQPYAPVAPRVAPAQAMPTQDEFLKQQDAQKKAFEAMQQKQLAKMESDRAAYEERMKQWTKAPATAAK